MKIFFVVTALLVGIVLSAYIGVFVAAQFVAEPKDVRIIFGFLVFVITMMIYTAIVDIIASKVDK